MEENKTFTQDELNSIIGDRLNKEKEKFTAQISQLEAKNKEYETSIATFNDQIKALNEELATKVQEAADKDAKLHNYETQAVKVRIANELGLPYELAQRLSGETEEEIRKDADNIKNMLGKFNPVQPLRVTESVSADPKEEALKQLSMSFRKD